MFPPVVEHVDEGVSHFTGRPQQARVIAIPPHSATAAEDAVDGLRDPDGEPANTALERRRLLRLYQQVQMVSLHAELEDPESLRARSLQSDLDGREEAFASQAR